MNKLKEEEKKWEAESSEEECSVEKWKRDQIISLVLYIINILFIHYKPSGVGKLHPVGHSQAFRLTDAFHR